METPFFFQLYIGADPAFVGIAVKFILVPGQIVPDGLAEIPISATL